MISKDKAIKGAVVGVMFAVGVAMCLAAPKMAHAATWGAWSDIKQASCYAGADEPWETHTATGKRITSKTKYVAVPMHRVTSKKSWKHLSKSQKYRFFYYGERIQLVHKHKGKTYKLVVTVEDCGGFGSYYGMRKGKRIERLFDLTPAVKRSLHVDGLGWVGLGWVRFRYEVS